jgi:hypothetical protein
MTDWSELWGDDDDDDEDYDPLNDEEAVKGDDSESDSFEGKHPDALPSLSIKIGHFRSETHTIAERQ